MWLNCSEVGRPYSICEAANVFIFLPQYKSDTLFIPHFVHLTKFNLGILNASVDVGIDRGIVGVDRDLDVTRVFQEFRVAKTGRGRSVDSDFR